MILFSSITLLRGIASCETKDPCRLRFRTLFNERSHVMSNFLHRPTLPGALCLEAESRVMPVSEYRPCIRSTLILPDLSLPSLSY